MNICTCIYISQLFLCIIQIFNRKLCVGKFFNEYCMSVPLKVWLAMIQDKIYLTLSTLAFHSFVHVSLSLCILLCVQYVSLFLHLSFSACLCLLLSLAVPPLSSVSLFLNLLPRITIPCIRVKAAGIFVSIVPSADKSNHKQNFTWCQLWL